MKNELSHHGIKGQKWGVRNGPPYPITPSKHPTSEKKAGRRKALSEAAKLHNKHTKERDELRNKHIHEAISMYKEAVRAHQDSHDERYARRAQYITVRHDISKKAAQAALITIGAIKLGELTANFVRQSIMSNGKKASDAVMSNIMPGSSEVLSETPLTSLMKPD